MEPSDRLRQARERAGYEKAVDAAKAYGWSVSTYISHENGTRGLRPKVAQKYAKALKIKADFLLYGTITPDRVPVEKRARDAVIMVPLLSWVSAGQLSFDADTDPDMERIAVAGLGNGDFIALRVAGDSMDRVSPDRSIIIVDRDVKDPVNGRYYVFSIRGEATYKIFRAGDPAYLEPFSTNPQNRPIFIKGKRDFRVVGRVRRTLLDL